MMLWGKMYLTDPIRNSLESSGWLRMPARA